MNSTIASLTVVTSLTLAVASGFFFTFSSPSVGQSSTGTVQPTPAQPIGVFDQEEAPNTPNDPLADFLAEENWITILAGTYEVGCDENRKSCRSESFQTYSVAKRPLTYGVWKYCVDSGYCDQSNVSDLSRSSIYYGTNPLNYIELQQAKDTAEWLSTLTKRRFYVPNASELQVPLIYLKDRLLINSSPYGDVDFLTSDCLIDEGYKYVSADVAKKMGFPSSWTGKLNTKSGQSCTTTECRKCSVVSSTVPWIPLSLREGGSTINTYVIMARN